MGALQVTVAWTPAPREVIEWPLRLPPGSTVLDALLASGLPAASPGFEPARAVVAVWGKKARLGLQLREGDRVEVLRPLTVDPKVARRERFARQGSRGTGLFASRRPGAKAGY